jgi:hypothetical protein
MSQERTDGLLEQVAREASVDKNALIRVATIARRRQQRNRIVRSALSTVFVLSFLMGVVLLASNWGAERGGGNRSGPADRTSGPKFDVTVPTRPAEFHVPSFLVGGMHSLSIRFPDGSTAEVSLDRHLGIATMAASPQIVAFLPGTCGSDLTARPYDLRGDIVSTESPLEVYSPSAALYEGIGANAPYYLVIVAGQWMVAVPCSGELEVVRQDAASWASLLTLHVNADGSLTAIGTKPLTIPGAGSGGPEVRFFDGRTILRLSPAPRCVGDFRTPVFIEPGYGRVCIEKAAGAVVMKVHSEDQTFVDSAVHSFAVDSVSIAS